MHLNLNTRLAEEYNSASQRIRILTESWVNNEVFCPNCGSGINHYENNRPVADFFCPGCKEDYELKSKKDQIGNKIVDGAYRTMIERLKSDNNPNLFLLNYSLKSLEVFNFFVIPKHFFVPEVIEKRKPLSRTARRAGWVGCSITLQGIPQSGKIFYIKNRRIEPKQKILKGWTRTLFLRDEKAALNKGWILDVMNCIDRLGKKEFSLDEIYSFKGLLQEKHPQNKHVQDKIRQQLQFLRDKGYLHFVKRGKYKLA